MPEKDQSERPLECSECKKSIEIYYTEIVGNSSLSSCMCKDCPILQQHLYGSFTENTIESSMNFHTGLCCGNCDTTLEAVRTGNPLGCQECYDVFSDVLVMEMLSSNKIYPRSDSENTKTPTTLHIGRSPGELVKINPSTRLIALNDALNATLASEDYEQAASLRDQIKKITEQVEQSNEQKP